MNRKLVRELDRANECAVEDSDDHSIDDVQWTIRTGAVLHKIYEAQLGRLKCECRLVEHGGTPCLSVRW
jgi:hypothetical protein